MRHFLVLTVFALLTAIVFGTVAKDNNRERLLYGAKVFGEFIGIGLVLAWILYFLPL